MTSNGTCSHFSDDPDTNSDSPPRDTSGSDEAPEEPHGENGDDQDTDSCNGNGDSHPSPELLPTRGRGLSLDKLLELNSFSVEILTVPPGNDVVLDVSNFFKTNGALYIEKATGTVSFAILESPNFRTVKTLNQGPYTIVNMYGPLPGEKDRDVEDGLWLQLSSEAGVFWGRIMRPLIAETPVEVWLVR
ncbi:hypothetical protein R1sor_024766 [Riccia sorocarpa]|uniref:AT-hook motif nuclear-localized protein n=1 Tax=Riccia sorocarpa TaxID=122646 RepID=A0ABD3GRE3_9MARC